MKLAGQVVFSDKPIQVIVLVGLLCLNAVPAYAQGAGIEWEILNQEVVKLYRAGKYDRTVVVTKAALKVAEKNVGPDHPDVATSLKNLAALYRATNRVTEAQQLDRRAAKIRAIKR